MLRYTYVACLVTFGFRAVKCSLVSRNITHRLCMMMCQSCARIILGTVQHISLFLTNFQIVTEEEIGAELY
jgi:hypothetical protein